MPGDEPSAQVFYLDLQHTEERMVRVYQDPYRQDQDGTANQFLLGFRGSQFLETGFITVAPP